MNLRNTRCHFNILVGLFAGLCICISGCAPAVKKPPVTRLCPGVKSIDELITIFNDHRQNVKAIKAGGKCIIQWYDSEKKPRKESSDVTLRFCPPDRLYLRANIITGEIIRVGSNSAEFWLQMKPKEISTYQWGTWSQAKNCRDQMLLGPSRLMEALGVVYIDKSFSLSSEDGFDILTQQQADGRPAKKIYVDNCSGMIKKIEYFDTDARLVVTLKLDDFLETQDGIVVPTKINIDYHVLQTSAAMSLKNVKPFKKIKDKLFVRPPPKGFKHVYKLGADCEFIEQEKED